METKSNGTKKNHEENEEEVDLNKNINLVVPPSKVIVHPLVLLSAVDHYNRVAKDTKNRVVGVLLGTVDRKTGVYEATSSFAVPFDEDAKDPTIWFLDHNFVYNMWDMFRRIAAKEVIIGWYSSGPKIAPCDITIHNQIFAKFISQPLYVIIDVKLEGQQSIGSNVAASAAAAAGGGGDEYAMEVDGMPAPVDVLNMGSNIPTDAYYAHEEIEDEKSQPKLAFVHLRSEIGAQEAEEIGVEQLLRDVKDTTVTDLHSSVAARLNSLKSFQDRLKDIHQYLQDVEAGKLPMNHQIMYLLQDVFNLLPGLQREDTQQAFVTQTNDTMLSMYTAGITRSIIALHNLIDNKVTLREEEKKQAEKFLKDANKANGVTANDGGKMTESSGEEKKPDGEKE